MICNTTNSKTSTEFVGIYKEAKWLNDLQRVSSVGAVVAETAGGKSRKSNIKQQEMKIKTSFHEVFVQCFIKAQCMINF